MVGHNTCLVFTAVSSLWWKWTAYSSSLLYCVHITSLWGMLRINSCYSHTCKASESTSLWQTSWEAKMPITSFTCCWIYMFGRWLSDTAVWTGAYHVFYM